MRTPEETKKSPAFFLLILLSACIFLIELGIMYLFDSAPWNIPPSLKAFLDSAVLALVVFPLFYLFGVAPLVRENQMRGKLEKQLRTSEERYKSLAETSPDCIKLFDMDRKLIYINRGGLQEHRLKDLEEAKRCDLLEGIVEEDRHKFIEAFQEAQKGNIETIEIRHTHEGSVREVCLETMAPVRDEDGKIACVFGVSRDISQIKELERTKELLAQMIVHDLNHPLNAVFEGLEYLDGKVRGKGQADVDRVLELCLRESREMIAMISELLDISKMEEGKMVLKHEKIQVGELVEDILRNFSEMAKTRKITLRSGIEPPVSGICGDVFLIRRVFLNLIGNAFKFSPVGTSIEITAAPQEKKGTVLFSVRDEGRGIPPEYHEKIFEKFAQVQNVEMKKSVGKGIGLTFCKMAVEAHGGRIWVESEAGKGTIFHFELPVSQPL
ncbi:MAG: PAS domain-containing sensor histidine kinase [Candidatus Omnitrophota bacterium]